MQFSEIRSLTVSKLGSKFRVCAEVAANRGMANVAYRGLRGGMVREARRPRYCINSIPRSPLRMGNFWDFDPELRYSNPEKFGKV